MSSLDLDVRRPDQVSGVLRNALDAYNERSRAAAYTYRVGDTGYETGTGWHRIALILAKAANAIDGLGV
jgi:hypothetical protein